ncbi:hypothetical protein NDU88_004978 [Pleurodeles waltl]|uniref:Uncharacterized protein n=1 Tax=Pleurodeles waltl TaxID=8319 RepID=A0AAV7UGQ9_PLEWA|nr:hypothetical protein NDU88_004978 [Pleurodeles waltl]
MATSVPCQLAQLLQRLEKFGRSGRRYRRTLHKAQLRESIRRGRSVTGRLRNFSFRFRRSRRGTNGRSRVYRLPPLLHELFRVRSMGRGLCGCITAPAATPGLTAPAPRCGHVPLHCTTRGVDR